MINPVLVCKRHNILIIEEDLGNVCGFYSNVYEQPTIHINVNIPEKNKLFALEHLLIEGYLTDPYKMKFLRCEQLDHILNSDKAI